MIKKEDKIKRRKIYKKLKKSINKLRRYSPSNYQEKSRMKECKHKKVIPAQSYGRSYTLWVTCLKCGKKIKLENYLKGKKITNQNE